MYNKYYKYSTVGFCIGHIKIKVPITKDKYDLKLPDPFTWKIYDHNKQEFKKETILFTTLPFDFKSLIDNLPYKRSTLEETITDDYRFKHEDYIFSSYPNLSQHNNLNYLMKKEGSELRCYNNISNERKKIIYNDYEEVTYMIFIEGTQGLLKYQTKENYSEKLWNKYGYDINKVYEIKPIKKDKLVIKNIHYWGAWLEFSGFI